MRTRWLAACLLMFPGTAGAQPPRAGTAFETPAPSAQLPLLPVPEPATPPAPFAPGGPVPGYDHNYLYLPEPGPEFAPAVVVQTERWRFGISAELAWLSTRPLPGGVRMTPRDLFGATVPALNLPTAGLGDEPFQAGLGLTVARRFGERGAVEGSLFVLPESNRHVDGYAPGTFVALGDPARPAPVIVRFPDGLAGLGSSFPATFSTNFVGADVNYRHALILTTTARLEVLAGYRFAHLADELFLGRPPEDDSSAYRNNRLLAETTFHGGQLGLAAELRGERWYTEGLVKLAYGAVRTRRTATGVFAFTDPAPRLCGETRPAFLPTASAKIGYRVTEQAGLFASYSFQYLDRVARLGDAFDPAGGRSDLWVQALGLGVEWRF